MPTIEAFVADMMIRRRRLELFADGDGDRQKFVLGTGSLPVSQTVHVILLEKSRSTGFRESPKGRR